MAPGSKVTSWRAGETVSSDACPVVMVLLVALAGVSARQRVALALQAKTRARASPPNQKPRRPRVGWLAVLQVIEGRPNSTI